MIQTSGLSWDYGLEGPARRIAEIDGSPIRVMAGPGTGKTFALMRRVARLLQNGAIPERILVCTFTRTAARDLQNELARLGVDGASRVRASTLHSFCFSVLSQNEVLQLTQRVPRPLLGFEERFVLEDLSGDGFGGIRDRERRLQAFNAAWARRQFENPGWPVDPVDQAFYRELIGWLKFHEAMLIGELVPETLRFLRDNPAAPIRQAFDHFIVDEYQDLNKAEQALLDLLSKSRRLIVVGDEDQSIYSFKFAHPDGIRTFDQTHPGTHDESLGECRRCPTRVVSMANALIANNATRAPRNLQPLGDNPEGEVLILQWQSLDEEANGIAELIRQRIAQGQVKPGNVLVLSPRRQIGYVIRDALNSLGVYAHSFFHEEALDGNPKDLDKCQAQQAFTLLTLLANPGDRVALRCWSGFGSDSLRSGAWSRIREHCSASGESPRRTLERIASGGLTLPYTGGIAERFTDLQNRLANLANLRGQALVDAFFPLDADWAKPLRSLAATIEGDDFDAATLREVLRVGITQPELPTDVDYVRIMSLHKSKGLTADLVVVVGCIEGLIPEHYDANRTFLSAQEFEEEQRRLFYVAITRTRNTLILSSILQLPRRMAHQMGARIGSGHGMNVRTITSRFISQLGPTAPEPIPGVSIQL